MDLEELKQSDWYKQRPKIIKQAICQLPPTQAYIFKETGKQCVITSFEEPESGKFEEVTCTVYKTGKGGSMEKLGAPELDTGIVFGVKLDALEPWEDEEE